MFDLKEFFMDKNLLMALTQNPELISGIYNFCDGWCERCSFTQKCLKYLMIEEGVADEKIGEEECSEENLDEVFQFSFELLNQAAKKMGMPLPSDEDEFDEEKEQQKDEAVFGSQIMLQADKYAELVENWFGLRESLIEERKKALHGLVLLGADAFTFPRSLDRFKDRCEVIQWYQFIIPSKLFRALRGQIEGDENANEFQVEDCRGSAKVALLAIDSSLEAWTGLFDFFPDEDDSILPILMLLSGMRTLVEAAFPDARSFQRPGFDTALD